MLYFQANNIMKLFDLNVQKYIICFIKLSLIIR